MEPAFDLDNVYPLEEAKSETSTNTNEETVLDAAIDWRGGTGEKGRGVFARRDIAKGEVIERAPVVPMSKDDIPESGGAPDGYVLEWDDETEGEEHALVLGYVMLYNHGENPNLHLDSDYEENTITVTALRDIKAGEELTWNYNCELWFDVE